MRQKESFFLISIKWSCASLRGGGGCSLSGVVHICGEGAAVRGAAVRLFPLNRYARAINMYVRKAPA